MDFDKIACTQEYDGDAMDAIFPKKRQTRKRKADIVQVNPVFKPPPPEAAQDSSPEADLNQSCSTPSQDAFVFTNDNIFKTREPVSVLFRKYFPPEVLQFTEAELTEINELYQSAQQEQQQRDRGRLTHGNVQNLDQTCLIAKFLKETREKEATDTSLGLDSQGFSQIS